MDLKRSIPLANAAVIAIAFLMYALLVSPEPVMKLAKITSAPVYRWPDEERVSPVCLVEWDSSNIVGILDELDKTDAGITFAVTGEWATKNEETARRIVKAGHGLALLASGAASAGDLRAQAEVIESVSGEAPLIAVCSPKDADSLKKSCAEAGLVPVVMTVTLSSDPQNGDTLDELLKNLKPGGCTIGFFPAEGAERLMHELIVKIKNMGYGIVPAHKMLYN